MRVTQGVLFQQTLSNLQNTLFRLTETRERALTGKNFVRPSQDPVGSSRLLNAQSESRRISQYLDNIGTVRSFLTASTSSLQNVSESFTEIRGQILSAASGNVPPEQRTVVAEALKQFLAELVGQANSSIQGQHVFAGTKTGESPFTFNSQGEVEYNGDSTTRSVPVGPGLLLPVSLSGDSIFLDAGSRELILEGTTGAASGRTQSSGKGTTFLDLQHSATFLGDEGFGAGGDTLSGLVPGSSSATGDTLLGPSGTHSVQLSVNLDGTGTVSLNNGVQVSFDGTETDLEIEGSNGELLHLDVTQAVAGFQGTVAIRSEGTLSIGDSGAIPITYSDNQEILDPTTGSRTFIDTTSLRTTGREVVTYAGSLDTFEVIQGLIADLESPGDLSPSEQADVIRSRLTDFDRATDSIRNAIAVLGSKSARLEAIETHVQDVDLNLQSLVSDIHDADVTQVILELSQLEGVYQASLQIGSRTFGLSLIDFI